MGINCVAIILFAVSSVLVVNGLQCHHCRLNLCDHEYCESAMNLFKESSLQAGEYIGVYNWSTIAPCPADWQVASQSGSPAAEFSQTCENLGDMCGQLLYNITTKSVLNIIPSPNDTQLRSQSVPVIGSGTNVYKSAVVVLGCIPISHKCRSGYKQNGFESPDSASTTTTARSTSTTTAAPAPATTTATSTSNSTKLNNLENINTVSNCCHCDEDLCNGRDLISKNGTGPATQTLQCSGSNSMNAPVFDSPSSNGNAVRGAHLFLTVVAPLIAAMAIALVIEK